jgi:glycosyltransferase involved in cell wall biosynthesis
MTLLEALAAGVVIIATPVGGTPSIVCDGVNGFLVERDPSQISDALDRLDNEREILSKMSAAGVQRYREHFTADDMRERYDTVYRQTGVLAAEATRNWAPIGKV